MLELCGRAMGSPAFGKAEKERKEALEMILLSNFSPKNPFTKPFHLFSPIFLFHQRARN